MTPQEYEDACEADARCDREPERGRIIGVHPARIRKLHVKGNEELARGVYVEWRGQRYGEGPELWCVTRRGFCLSRDGLWEYEPLPSSRDNDFIARCRWGSFEEAYNAACAVEDES